MVVRFRRSNDCTAKVSSAVFARPPALLLLAISSYHLVPLAAIDDLAFMISEFVIWRSSNYGYESLCVAAGASKPRRAGIADLSISIPCRMKPQERNIIRTLAYPAHMA